MARKPKRPSSPVDAGTEKGERAAPEAGRKPVEMRRLVKPDGTPETVEEIAERISGHKPPPPKAKTTRAKGRHKRKSKTATPPPIGTPGLEEIKAAKAKREAGRPTDYTPKIAALILTRIADGETLGSVCRTDGMPHRVTVWRWLADREDFATLYARAREEQADAIFDEIMDIADDTSGDGLGGKEGHEAVQRSKLRVETRLKIVSRLNPKKYGEKVDLNVGHTVVSDEKINERLDQLLGTFLPPGVLDALKTGGAPSEPEKEDA